MSAFRKAIELGADMIELDARKCASGELVVIHDAGLKRAFGVSGLVRQKNLVELKNLASDPDRQIPTLAEALKFIRGRTALDIELKERGTAREALAVIKASLGSAWSWNKLSLSSRHHNELVAARDESREIELAPIYLSWPFGYKNFGRKIRAKNLKLNHIFTTKTLVKQAQGHAFGVWVWTVNSHRQIAKFKDWGVDGIISNYPERL